MGTINVKEFKMWLQGVEEMQQDGWIPDARQWAKIREKIDQIDDTAPSSYTPAPPNNWVASPQQPQYRAIPDVDAVELPPTFQIPPSTGYGAPPPGALPLATRDGASVQTPNIDTSSGQYRSTFA